MVIDDLVLVFQLDASKFTAAQKQALESLRKLEEQSVKSGKEVEAQGKRILDFFSNLKREALGFVAAFYGGKGIKDIIGHLTQLDASAARLSTTVNAAPHDIALWRIAMQTIGGSAQDADSAIQGLSDAWQDFLRNPGNPPAGLLAAFKQIGLAPGDYDKPLKALEALARYGQTPGVSGAEFGAVAREFPGMNQHMMFLLLELDKRLKAAEKVTPKEGGLGAFSEEFIASTVLFSTAANNVARVLLDYFVPAIKSLTGLLSQWIATSGSPEAEKIEADFNKDLKRLDHPDRILKGTSKAFTNWVDSLFETSTPPKTGVLGTSPTPKLVPKGDTGIGGVFGGATGYEIVDPKTGRIIDSGGFPQTGARGAAATNAVHNRWHHQASHWSNATHIGTIHVNAPNAKDARGIAGSIKGALDTSLGAPINSAY